MKHKKGCFDMEEYWQRESTKILKQLEFAKNNVPFYKEKLKDIDIRNIKNYADFNRFVPTIDQEEVIENPELFKSNCPIEFVRHSSSTTGNPKKVFLTKDDIRQWIVNGRLTITPYYKPKMVVGHSKRTDEKYYLSALDETVKDTGGSVETFDPRDILEIIECIKKSDLILDYSEMICYISEQIKDLDINLAKSIILSHAGNKLTEEDVQRIKTNFLKIGVKVKIYGDYSTTEVGPIGVSHENEINSFRIVYRDNAFIEIVNPETNEPSEDGEIAVTALNRNGSVFIRYKVGDLGSINFKNEQPYFNFKGRKSGIKIASVFFSPQQMFQATRQFLKRPVFCNIEITNKDHLGVINSKIVTEDELDIKQQKKLREHLLRDLEFIDDIGSTVEFNIYFENRMFTEKEIRKGFVFRGRDILQKELNPLVLKPVE